MPLVDICYKRKDGHASVAAAKNADELKWITRVMREKHDVTVQRSSAHEKTDPYDAGVPEVVQEVALQQHPELLKHVLGVRGPTITSDTAEQFTRARRLVGHTTVLCGV